MIILQHWNSDGVHKPYYYVTYDKCLHSLCSLFVIGKKKIIIFNNITNCIHNNYNKVYNNIIHY